MKTENDLASRVQALEDRITRMSRDYDDTMYNIGSENLSAELSHRLNGMVLKHARKSKTISSSESGYHSVSVDMEKPVKAVVFVTVCNRIGDVYTTVNDITFSGTIVTISTMEALPNNGTVTVHALVTS